jgi:exosortase
MMQISTEPASGTRAAETFSHTSWTGAGLLQGTVLATLVIILYFRIVASLIAQWIQDPNYSHGFFIPLFSAWVIWKERQRLRNAEREPSWMGLLVILVALGTLLLGVLGAENFLSRASLVLLIAGLISYFYGWTVFRTVLFPWACLFLMIPIPAIIFNEIALPLQFQASKLASGMLSLVGVPVLREGNVIHLPSITLDVVEACSGLRSLVSLIALAVICGYVFGSRPLRRLLLVVAAVPVAVVANGFRIMGSGILGEYWSTEKAEGFFHLFSGLLVFLVSFGLLMALHGLFALLDLKLQRRNA